MKRLSVIGVVILAVLAFAVPVCAKEKTNGEAVKDSLVYALNGEPATLDPMRISDNLANGVFFQIFDTLVTLDSKGNLIPRLASSYTISPDGKVITFKLRKDVKFHNGDPFTADDAVFSLNRAIASKFMTEETVATDYAEKIDDFTVALHYKVSYAPGIKCLNTIFMVPKKLVEADEDGFGRHPVGTGPYVFNELKRGDKFLLSRNENYFRGVPKIKYLTFKIMTDSAAARNALFKGEVDLVAQPAMADRQLYIDNKNVNYYETELRGNTFIAFNNSEGRFANKKLRQAVAYAVDKESMLLGAIEGAGVSITNPLPRQCFGYADIKGYEYDVEKAKQCLKEAGYPDGLTVTLKTMESPTYYKPTEVLQDQLRRIGIKASIEKMERGAYLADVYANAKYELTCMSNVYVVADGDCLYPFFHSGNIGEGLNFFMCNDPRVDELLDKGRISQDPEERKAIYKELAQYLVDECVVVPLYAYYVGIAVNKDLQGVEPSANQQYEVFNYSWAK